MSKLTVQTYQKALTLHAQRTAVLRAKLSHWSPAIAAALDEAARATEVVSDLVDQLAPDWLPPRKQPTRQYAGIKVGDTVTVAERYLKRTPLPLRAAGLQMLVVAVEDSLVTVELVVAGEKVRYALARHTLVPVRP